MFGIRSIDQILMVETLVRQLIFWQAELDSFFVDFNSVFDVKFDSKGSFENKQLSREFELISESLFVHNHV